MLPTSVVFNNYPILSRQINKVKLQVYFYCFNHLNIYRVSLTLMIEELIVFYKS